MSSTPFLETGHLRERCYGCWRPQELCFCEAIPSVENQTPILLLQHVAERMHAFNTARIVAKSLSQCELIYGHTTQLTSQSLPIAKGAGLLYPSADAPVLGEVSPSDRPRQLVVIDGTWSQAKGLVRDLPQLRDLPCFRIAPSSPGQYRIRKEPNDVTLSTLEATVAALRELEPDTEGLDQLLLAFHRMVDDQVERLGGRSELRRKQNRGLKPRHVPHGLLQDPSKIVIAYGESSPRINGQDIRPPKPVIWVARRLSEPETFSCVLRQDLPPSSSALQHMRLTVEEIDRGVDEAEFRRRWDAFVRPGDWLVVYHHRTCRLLQHVSAVQPRCLVLKSIFGNWVDRFRSLEELADAEQLLIDAQAHANRAEYRLELAQRLVERLRERR